MSFELAWPQRSHRVRFKKPVRVVPLVDGPPRAYRVLSGNISKNGMFLSMPEPFAEGTQVALSLEAGGRILPFAQGEVRWRQATGVELLPGHVASTAGFGVRFTNFLHPRAHELVDYLVSNLDTGRPLALPPRKRWKRVARWAAGAVACVCLCAVGVMLARQVPIDGAESKGPRPSAEAPSAQGADVAQPEPTAAAVGRVSTELGGPSAETPAAAAPTETVPQKGAPQQGARGEDALLKPASREALHTVEALPLENAGPGAEPTFVAAQPAPVAPAAAPSSTGLLPLPKCGASSLRWAHHGQKLTIEVAPVAGGRVAAAFRLKNPERLVIDLLGVAPKRSHLVKAAEIPNVSALRIGKRKAGGTRLVLDLRKSATLEVEGARLELAF